MSIPQLPPQEAHDRVTRGALLVDVREQGERDAAHVPGSLFLPMSRLPDGVDGLPADRPLVIQCAHGVRSQQVAGWLAQQGFDVANQQGGIHAWADAGLPLTTD